MSAYWALSKRGYPMLREFAQGGYMTIAQAQAYDQRPFRSMLIRKWVAYTGHGFHITAEGKKAWYEFEHTDIARKNPTLPLTSYFDPAAYGLKKLRIVKRSAA